MTREEYLRKINSDPLPEMIKENPDGSKYIPISIIQEQLLQIYGGETMWDMERDTITAKGAWGKGKLSYLPPYPGSQWLHQSGTASIPFNNTLRLGYPSLESHCILNAAKKIGKWFGRDLNRDLEDAPILIQQEGENPERLDDPQHERLRQLIRQSATLEELGKFKKEASQIPEVMTIYMNQAKKLNTV